METSSCVFGVDTIDNVKPDVYQSNKDTNT